MQSTGSMRAQIGTLVIATSVIQLANGFFGTFISLRVAIEDFGATMAGLVLSSYFAGFTLGALRADGSSSGSGTSAPTPRSAASWSPRPRPCRSGLGPCHG